MFANHGLGVVAGDLLPLFIIPARGAAGEGRECGAKENAKEKQGRDISEKRNSADHGADGCMDKVIMDKLSLYRLGAALQIGADLFKLGDIRDRLIFNEVST